MNVYAAQHNTLLLHFCKLLLVLHMNVFMYVGPTATPRSVASISSQSGGGAADEVEGILHPFHSPPVHSMEYSLQVTVILAPYSEHTHTRITNNVTNSPNEQQKGTRTVSGLLFCYQERIHTYSIPAFSLFVTVQCSHPPSTHFKSVQH